MIAQEVMTTQEVANRLVELCRQGQFEQATKELYADNIVSLEQKGTNFPERVEGLEAVIAKGQQFNSMVETFHGVEVSDPIVANNYFVCKMTMDITFKGAPRKNDEELCVYKVEGGKIVQEEFLYPVSQG